MRDCAAFQRPRQRCASFIFDDIGYQSTTPNRTHNHGTSTEHQLPHYTPPHPTWRHHSAPPISPASTTSPPSYSQRSTSPTTTLRSKHHSSSTTTIQAPSPTSFHQPLTGLHYTHAALLLLTPKYIHSRSSTDNCGTAPPSSALASAAHPSSPMPLPTNPQHPNTHTTTATNTEHQLPHYTPLHPTRPHHSAPPLSPASTT